MWSPKKRSKIKSAFSKNSHVFIFIFPFIKKKIYFCGGHLVFPISLIMTIRKKTTIYNEIMSHKPQYIPVVTTGGLER